MTVSNLYLMLRSWVYILGLLREVPPRTGHQRNLPSKAISETCRERLEVIHLVYIASHDWELFWSGELGNSMKELSMNVIFQYFALHAGRTIITLTYALTCLPRLVTIYSVFISTDSEATSRGLSILSWNVIPFKS